VKDTEEIRKKLAMDSENDESSALRLLNLKKANVCCRVQSGMNIQICFMNEISADNNCQVTELDNVFDLNSNNNGFEDILSNNDYLCGALESKETELNLPVLSESFNSLEKQLSSMSSIPKPKNREEFSVYHSHLFAEARAVLFHAKKWSKFKMHFEQMNKKRSSINGLLDLPLKGKWKKQDLFNLGVSQLQLIVNDFHTQIETLNDMLVKLLLERDELHMEQDSILVDVEDLTVFL
ncbi:uncharacterized protein B4U80_01964, partial [Leptotrombidium deliense]